MSDQRLAVATFGKLDSMCPEKWVAVAGSKPPDYMWSDSVFNFDLGNFRYWKYFYKLGICFNLLEIANCFVGLACMVLVTIRYWLIA